MAGWPPMGPTLSPVFLFCPIEAAARAEEAGSRGPGEAPRGCRGARQGEEEGLGGQEAEATEAGGAGEGLPRGRWPA